MSVLNENDFNVSLKVKLLLQLCADYSLRNHLDVKMALNLMNTTINLQCLIYKLNSNAIFSINVNAASRIQIQMQEQIKLIMSPIHDPHFKFHIYLVILNIL